MQAGVVTASRALVDDRTRMVVLDPDDGRCSGVGHPLEGLRDDDRMAVQRAAPEGPSSDALNAGVIQSDGQLLDFQRHGPLYDDGLRVCRSTPRKSRNGDSEPGGDRER